jgi:Protein of unknown function (DUF2950)
VEAVEPAVVVVVEAVAVVDAGKNAEVKSMLKLPTFRQASVMLAFLVLIVFMQGCATVSPPQFNSPDHAVDALVQSLRTNDTAQLKQILGPDAETVLSSGDEVSDAQHRQAFLNDYDQKHQLVPASPEKPGDKLTLVVGNDDWPLPIPLVRDQQKGTWSFDTAAGLDEIINRRIGRNELDTIQVCLAIVDAQREYATSDPEQTGIPIYAQKFFSDPGKKNGLYWKTSPDEKPSPLGPLVASAAELGYTSTTSSTGEPQPFHGYLFRMLKSQGPSAPGGELDYVVNDKMIGGFAVVAYPAEYGNSGVMTFIVSEAGIVYQQDLGSDTKQIALDMKAFDPDANWQKVQPADTTQP